MQFSVKDLLEKDIRITAEAEGKVVVGKQADAFNLTTYYETLENEVGHDLHAEQSATLSLDTIDTGVEVRLKAGQTSKVTLTGLAGWHFLTASLTVNTVSRRMTLPLDNPFEPTLGGSKRTHTFDPPIFAHKLVSYATGESSNSIYTVSHFPSSSLPDTSTSTKVDPIGSKVSKIENTLFYRPFFYHPSVLIIDNAPSGIALSNAQDQILHRIPQELGYGQSATTPDLTETLNAGVDAGQITLNLLCQSDGVVCIKGTTTQIHRATGYAPTEVETAISPWHPVTITPTPAKEGLPQTTVLTATSRATGAAHLGLMNTASATYGVYPTPHVALAQPFQPCTTPKDGPITITGCWLFLDAPPETDVPVTLSIHRWDSDLTAPGEQITQTTATISAALMDHKSGPNGLIAAWVTLIEPWVLDTPDQMLLHAIVLTEMDAPLRLLECPRTHAQLMPFMSKITRRDAAWSVRDFGAADKALSFELGYETVDDPRGTLTITHAGGTVTQAVMGKETDFMADVRHGTITFQSDVELDLTNLECVTQTAVFT